MAEIVFTQARVKIGTSDAPTTTLTQYLRSATINYSAELVDKTAMGNNSRRRVSGLKDANVSLEFNHNYASTDAEKFFFSLVGTESSNCWIQIKPTSSTSPRYFGRFLSEGWSPMSGGVGDLATHTCSFQGDGDFTRSSATA